MSGVSDYLQISAKVLRIRHEPGVFISFVEPGTAANFSGGLLPVHSIARPLLDMYIIPLSIHSYHHFLLLFSYYKVNRHSSSGNRLVTDYIPECFRYFV